MIPLDLKDAKKLPQGIPTILVPFREQVLQKRGEQLKKFTAHMKRWHPDWPVLVIEQSEDGKQFNKGALMNIGTRYAQKMGATYIIIHDVDLIPLSPIVPLYTGFPEKPINIGHVWQTKWQGVNFRGVQSISMKDMKTINGFPNMLWGWGGEDDAMQLRLKKKGIKYWNPQASSGFKVLEHPDTRKIPGAKNMRKWEDLKEDTGRHGLNDVKWKLLDEKQDQNIFKYTVEIK
uniref:Galactosyltransferase C-terminal domain-containing protein n=1 Tax=viral metagenome TaxID=1070528 RepID=A0A6C0HGG6_9ZZZZ